MREKGLNVVVYSYGPEFESLDEAIQHFGADKALKVLQNALDQKSRVEIRSQLRGREHGVDPNR